MPKKSPEPDAQKQSADGTDKPSLVEKVERWATGQGYPFELTVGQQLRQAGWNVQHVQFYTDLQGCLNRGHRRLIPARHL